MELIQIKREELKILERLMQLYLHDISLYFPIDFDENLSKYVYDSLEKYFDDYHNYAYFIKFERKIAGFILVETTEQENTIQEMFILNHHKNKGLGKLAVHEVLNKYKNKWIIKSLPCSEPAEKFWTKTISNYTNNNYTLEHIGKYSRAVYSFTNIE